MVSAFSLKQLQEEVRAAPLLSRFLRDLILEQEVQLLPYRFRAQRVGQKWVYYYKDTREVCDETDWTVLTATKLIELLR